MGKPDARANVGAAPRRDSSVTFDEENSMGVALPLFYFVLAFVSSGGGTAAFILALRASGKKGYLFALAILVA